MVKPPELLASSHPNLTAAFYLAAGLYALGWLATVVRPALGRWVIAAGAAVHLGATVGRGVLIDFFPLTNKMESFSACALALALVAVLTWRASRVYGLVLLTLLGATMATALSFPLDLAWPPPLMRTLWYPLHVPLSFFAYALWSAAAAGAAAWLFDRDAAWLARIDRLALWGFVLWSLSMICGGFWGVVAWGAYFLWDPKVIWSVILWFHYATFAHLHLTPSLQGRAWVRPALALVGLVWIFIAYVGTSFLFGRSSHAF